MKEKLKNDIQQLTLNHKADLRDREQIERLLNRDLNSAKDEISTMNGEIFHLTFPFSLQLFCRVCKLNMNEL